MTSESVLDIFKEITTIPRESGHEGPITAWLTEWAVRRGLECKVDHIGNVLIVREAAPGKENVPTIVLQAHQDMVCEKNPGVEHDFAKDPINYVIEDGWMIAKDTTLGADDGIGIAACLALLEDKAPTGKIECLFTISEETGMDGAMELKPGFFEGKTLINLDSEDEGQLFIGCAGGLNTSAVFRIAHEPVRKKGTIVRVHCGGGIGGHGGDDINKGRANTVQLLARFLYSRLDSGFQLVSINGGGKPNAIARNSEAILCVDDPEAMEKAAEQYNADIKEEFHVTDPKVFCTVREIEDKPLKAIRKDHAERIITALFACPHGMQAMSQDIEGLVQTSTNLASVKKEGDEIIVTTSQRSSVESKKEDACDHVSSVFYATEAAEVTGSDGYPGWEPNPKSKVLDLIVEAYHNVFHQEPVVKAIHAGLECGLFSQKYPDLDMVSFGPTLRGVHSPDEKLEIATVQKCWDLIVEFFRILK